MKRRDALKSIGVLAGSATVSRLLAGCGTDEAVGSIEQAIYDPNFGLLKSNTGWRRSWTHIVPGKFTASSYTGLFFYDATSGAAEVYETDGAGGLIGPFWTSSQLGGRATWTHLVPGLYGGTGFTGVLLFDRTAGVARFLVGSGGGFVATPLQTGWRTSWTQIVAGLFTDSRTSSLFFYSPSENAAEVWDTDANGLAGTAPVASFAPGSQWTHIVAADFAWTPGYINSTPLYSDLLFYDAADGSAQIWNTTAGVTMTTGPLWTLMAGATNVVAGNFGGPFGNPDVVLHDRARGQLRIYAVGGQLPFTAVETLTALRTTVDIVVPGTFSLSNPDDHWFDDGPGAPVDYDRNWRAGLGAFKGVLAYDRAAGQGDVYFHEPLPPPAADFDAYITSASSHRGNSPVASGSVLPGERIDFHVTSTTTYAIDIVRIGDFGDGSQEQLMMHVGSFAATPAQPISRTGYRDGAGWPVAASFVIPSSYPSGVYMARFSACTDACVALDVPFVVRATSASRAHILMVITDMTYAAYNDWGGRNVYGCAMRSETGGRASVTMFPQSSAHGPYAFQVSFERPVAYTLFNSIENDEIPMLRWLMKSGVPVDVCTARDLHFEAPDTGVYRLLVFAGHHEYWTKAMRDHVEAFTAAGRNVCFFSGNTCWWQVRIGADGKTLTCFKNAGFDVGAAPEVTTVNWWDAPVNRPETAMTGVSFRDGFIPGDDPADGHFEVTNPNHWAFQNTGLATGTSFGVFAGGNVIGNEIDTVQDTTPAGYTCANAVFTDGDGHRIVGGMMGSFTNNGEVFNTATINWARGLADASPSNLVPRITMNAIDRLGPRFQTVSGLATDIGVGANDQVWIITTTPVTGGFSIQKRVGSSWTTISNGGVRIAADPSGNPWVVNSNNAVLRFAKGAWQTMPGSGTDIGIGANGAVWMIGTGTTSRPIFRWTGSAWTQMPGSAVRIAVGPTGNAWVVNVNHQIFEWTGSAWQNRPGLAIDVGVGPDGTVWVVGVTPASGGGGNGIFRWTGSDWRQVVGGGTQISVGMGGVPWIVSDTHAISTWG